MADDSRSWFQRFCHDWLPLEELRGIFRHVIVWLALIAGFSLAIHVVKWIGIPAFWEQTISYLDGFVATGALIVLGARLIVYLWKVTGSHHGLIIAA
jgi:predicted permease